MIDPVEALMKTSSLLVPTSSSAPAVDPIPTVIRPEYQEASEVGTRTLWVVFVIMLIASVAFYAMAFRVPVQKRMFHILTAFITTFATISYFAMATGDGISLNHVVLKTHSSKHGLSTYKDLYREVYWARYVDWSVTTPLLLLDLALLAGLNGANILVAIVADLIMILTGLFAAFAEEGGKQWGYYAMACLAYLVIIYQLAVHGRATAMQKDSKTGTFFTAIAGFTLILWTIYPIVWGIADGSRNINVDAEIIAYAILDVLAKPIFGFWLLFTHDAMPSTSLSIEGFWAHGAGKEGQIRVGEDDEGA
ncbi:hypothetical protein MMC09_002240 [Bachmanniomyces sp. S44760]|nr:hypothetical protein [Bachmanniomyces sp. S44760]